jgi:(S)-ureidoglycine aminohydrolase
MGPYCPQFCFCTGWEEAAYLLYKDVNRDVTFG